MACTQLRANLEYYNVKGMLFNIERVGKGFWEM